MVSRVGYKVSVVRLGVVDYQANQRRLLALLLKEPGQEARFAALRDYLRDERSRVKLADGDYSQLPGADLTPDDLFTLDYLDVTAERLPAHYRNLIQAKREGKRCHEGEPSPLVPTLRVGMHPGTLGVPCTRSRRRDTGRGASGAAFPRGAWEREEPGATQGLNRPRQSSIMPGRTTADPPGQTP